MAGAVERRSVLALLIASFLMLAGGQRTPTQPPAGAFDYELRPGYEFSAPPCADGQGALPVIRLGLIHPFSSTSVQAFLSANWGLNGLDPREVGDIAMQGDSRSPSPPIPSQVSPCKRGTQMHPGQLFTAAPSTRQAGSCLVVLPLCTWTVLSLPSAPRDSPLPSAPWWACSTWRASVPCSCALVRGKPSAQGRADWV